MHPHVASVSAFSWCGASESERRAGLPVTGRRSRESLSAARRGASDMASAVQKIKLSPSRDIPFNKLVLSQSNVRRVKAGVSIEQLAESIGQRTLLQGLNVRAVVDADGQETGMFEVPAGGRRYRALELLIKQKRMAKTEPVPCVVRNGGIAEDDSLAENNERVGLHPLDQFRAFKLLRDGGMSEEDIAARHFVSPAIVKQRLRLASVSPKLHDVYANDGMTLEQLMAFSVTADQARQEQAWDNVSRSGNDEPYQIRRMLTENTVRASDRRAQFVGLDIYEQAGGIVLRDLFAHDDGGWLQDVPLLDRLATEKLKAEAETIAAEGWKWIAVAVDFPYGHTNGLREIEGEPADLTEEEQATLDALNAEHVKIEENYQDADELPDEIDQRLGEIEGRGPSWNLDRLSTIQARSPAPACSSASMPRVCWRSTVATCGRKMRHPASSIPKAKYKATEIPTMTGLRPMVWSNARSSPSAVRHPNPSRRTTTTRSSHCRIGSSPS